MHFPGDANNTMQPKLDLPSAMSLDLPLIPDILPEQPRNAPLNHGDISYPSLLPDNHTMPMIGNRDLSNNDMPAIGMNYSYSAQPSTEVISSLIDVHSSTLKWDSPVQNTSILCRRYNQWAGFPPSFSNPHCRLKRSQCGIS